MAISRIGETEQGLRIINDYLTQDDVPTMLKALAYYERSRIYYRDGFFDTPIEDAELAIRFLHVDNAADFHLLKLVHYALGVYYGRICRYALSIFHYARSRTFVGDQNDKEAANILLGLGHHTGPPAV